jgi:hypothetical protein
MVMKWDSAEFAGGYARIADKAFDTAAGKDISNKIMGDFTKAVVGGLAQSSQNVR